MERDRERGVPHHALLARDHLALHLDGFLLVGVERDAILDVPDRANRTHVRTLRAQQGVQVQTLGVVKCQFHKLLEIAT